MYSITFDFKVMWEGEPRYELIFCLYSICSIELSVGVSWHEQSTMGMPIKMDALVVSIEWLIEANFVANRGAEIVVNF